MVVFTLQSENFARNSGAASRIWLAIGLCLACGVLSGCVSRRVVITTNPPGALVIVDGKELGHSPVSFDYTYYGTREVTLIKDGYQTMTAPLPLQPPWYQRVGVDFFSDNLSFHHHTDRRRAHWDLQPQQIVPTDELYDRARGLRSDALFSP